MIRDGRRLWNRAYPTENWMSQKRRNDCFSIYVSCCTIGPYTPDCSNRSLGSTISCWANLRVPDQESLCEIESNNPFDSAGRWQPNGKGNRCQSPSMVLIGGHSSWWSYQALEHQPRLSSWKWHSFQGSCSFREGWNWLSRHVNRAIVHKGTSSRLCSAWKQFRTRCPGTYKSRCSWWRVDPQWLLRLLQWSGLAEPEWARLRRSRWSLLQAILRTDICTRP